MTDAAVDAVFAHERLLASAGSGKTWQLTTRYLRLVLAGCDPRAILASTFTRLAAGEIRDRILNRLAEAAEDPDKREALRQALGLRALSRDDALHHLAALARQMHHMQIRTLDSYFASIVRGFALELGIPPGADVVDEAGERALRHEAIRRMLDERDPQKIISMLRQLAGGGAKRAVTDEIDRNIGGLYQLYRESDAGAWDCIRSRTGFLPHDALTEAIDRLADATVPNDKRFIKARDQDCSRARLGDWNTFIEKGLSGKIAAGATSYYNKAIDDELLTAYQPLIRHAAALLVNRWRDQTLATRRLLASFHNQFAALKHERLALTFSDLVAILNTSPEFAEFSDICFRLDAQIEHLLLDEFQDTSVSQWRALDLICRELAQRDERGRSIFAVGDVKQSIYGWRGAEPEILEHLPQLLFGDEDAMQQHPLATSYRSSPEVIDTVNQVFGFLTSNSVLDDFADVTTHWHNGFEHHSTVRTDTPGYVQMRVVERADERKQSHHRLQVAANLIADLHARNPELSIGVLTRTNKAAGRLMYELGPSNHGIAVGSRGGGPLIDAAPVNVLLDLLTLADHPDHTVAAFNVANSPLAKPLEIDPKAFHSADASPRRRAIARLVRRMLADRGYARSLAHWIETLSPDCDGREQRRLAQLLELATAYESQAGVRADDFVRYVESMEVVDTRPAPVQVMTIHKSKGLDFDIVVLPELDFKLKGLPPAVVYTRPGVDQPPDRICRYAKEHIRQFAPRLEPLFEQHTNRQVRESLCTLYVAMTRAKRGLYMLIDPPPLNKGDKPSATIPKTPAGVLRCAFDAPVPEPGTVVFEHGHDAWIDSARSADDAAPERRDPARIERIAFASPTGRVRRGATQAASAHEQSIVELASQLGVDDSEARDRGTAVHALFERIAWLDDGVPERAELERVARRAALRRGNDWIHDVVDAFLTMIEQATVRKHLSGAGKPTNCRVERELPFARFDADATARGAIDRLVVEFDDDGVTPRSATVIDFKTDAISADQTCERAEQYRGQMNAYRKAAAELLGVDPAVVRATLLFVAADVAVDVE